MKTSTRIMYNTAALYLKMFLTTIISLFLTRVVLKKLGVEDFGIYNLIGGVITLLSFLQTALSISTQRFLSVAMGKNDSERIRMIFSSSIMIHCAFACIILLLFESVAPFIFDGFLNIPAERLSVAEKVYQIMIISTIVSIVTVPYNAVITAHEDIWFFAIVETFSAVLKLGIVFLFNSVNIDSLMLYSFWMLFTIIIGALLKYIWCFVKYEECTLKNIFTRDNVPIAKEMLGFTGWNAFGSLALIGRNQGVAILINIFWGATINGVYAIANQLNGQLIHISQTMTQAITPQIAKSYGNADYERLRRLSFFASKIAFYLSAVFALPLLIELKEVLLLWLGDIPEHTETYIILCLIMFLIMELYPGISRAVQATGKIRTYQIFTSLFLLLPIPIGYVVYTMGWSHQSILYLMIVSQILQLLFAVYYGYKVRVLKIKRFLLYMFKSTTLFVVLLCGGLYLKDVLLDCLSSVCVFIIITVLSVIVFTLSYYIIILDEVEKNTIKSTITSIMKKIDYD